MLTNVFVLGKYAVSQFLKTAAEATISKYFQLKPDVIVEQLIIQREVSAAFLTAEPSCFLSVRGAQPDSVYRPEGGWEDKMSF